jgi:aminopeptidase N
MFKDEALVLDKWFALQAGAPDRGGNILPIVKQLMHHPDFNIRNPNRARSVIFSYLQRQPRRLPPQRCRRLRVLERARDRAGCDQPAGGRAPGARLDRWRKLAEPLRSAAREAIARVAARPDLSNDVREVVSRALAE